MQFGEAAAPVSWFVQREGPVFLSGTSNMLILLGHCLEFSVFPPRRIAFENDTIIRRHSKVVHRGETAPVPPLTLALATPPVETSKIAESDVSSEPSFSVPVTLRVQRISSFIHVARTSC